MSTTRESRMGVGGYMRTLHEHERIRGVVRAVAVLRDRDLRRAEALPDGQCDDGRVVRGYLRRVGLDLRVERLRARDRVRVVAEERRDLHPHIRRQLADFPTSTPKTRRDRRTASPMVAKRVQKNELRAWTPPFRMTYWTTGSRTWPIE